MPTQKKSRKKLHPHINLPTPAATPITAFDFLRQNLLTFDELVILFNVCPKTMKRYCKKYGLHGSKLGRMTVYFLQDMQAFIEKRKQQQDERK